MTISMTIRAILGRDSHPDRRRGQLSADLTVSHRRSGHAGGVTLDNTARTRHIRTTPDFTYQLVF